MISADRITDVPRSFIREILKVTLDRSVISFAGGLPNRDLFPIAELKAAAMRVFDEEGAVALHDRSHRINRQAALSEPQWYHSDGPRGFHNKSRTAGATNVYCLTAYCLSD